MALIDYSILRSHLEPMIETKIKLLPGGSPGERGLPGKQVRKYCSSVSTVMRRDSTVPMACRDAMEQMANEVHKVFLDCKAKRANADNWVHLE